METDMRIQFQAEFLIREIKVQLEKFKYKGITGGL